VRKYLKCHLHVPMDTKRFLKDLLGPFVPVLGVHRCISPKPS